MFTARRFTRILLIIVLLATTLGPGASTARADGTPWIQVFYNPNPDANMVEASVFGLNWPLGAVVTLNIDDPETSEESDYTATATARALDPPGADATIAEFGLLGVFPLRAGMLVTLTDDPLTASRQVIVGDPRVTLFRYSNETIAGTADPNSVVEVANVHGVLDNDAQRRVTADANGDWLADFSLPGEDDDEQTTLDLEPGQQAFICQLEADGDRSCKSWEYGSIFLIADLARNRVIARQWERDATVTLTVNDPLSPALPAYTAVGQMYVNDPAYPLETYFQFNLPPGIYLKAGLVVTVGDGSYTHTLTVQDIGLTRVDVDEDIVTGTAAAGSLVNVMVWSDDPYSEARRSNISTAPDGVWTADFSQSGPNDGEVAYDLQAENYGRAEIWDEDGDRTRISWPAPAPGRPGITVKLSSSRVTGRGWPVGAAVTLTIDDPATPKPVDFQRTKIVVSDSSGSLVDFRSLVYPLRPGMLVRLTDGVTTREHTLYNLWIKTMDLAKETVRGIGYPLTRVQVSIYCTGGDDIFRYVYTDASGNWSVDYSEPGPTPDEPAANLSTACSAEAAQSDADGDRTSWSLQYAPLPANYYLRANLTENVVWANEWPVGSNVLLTINDPDTGAAPDFSMRQLSTRTNARLNFALWDLFDLDTGQQVALTDGVTSYAWTLAEIRVTGLDAGLERISGSAPALSTVTVCPADAGDCMDAPVDAAGLWSADLAAMGYDLQPGSWGEAILFQGGEAGASVDWRLGWTAPDPETLVIGTDASADYSLETPSYSSLAGQLQEPLFTLLDGGALQPAAALGYTVSADGLVYTVNLRPEARWSDGAPVTAQHFVDGVLHVLDPANGADFAVLLYPIAGAEDYNTGVQTDPGQVGIQALDPLTLQITLHDPAVYFPQALAYPNLLPVRKDLIELYGDEWAQAGKFASNGPYSLVERDRAHLRLVVNPYYHSLQKITFTDVVFTQIPMEAARLEAFRNGEVDVLLPLAWGWAALGDPQLAPAIRFYRSYGMVALGLNQQQAPTDNLLVRKALALAIDDQAVVETMVPGGVIESPGGVIPPGVPGYQEAVGYTLNAALARQYLADAGYPDGVGFPEITLVGPSGHQLRLEEVARQWRLVLNIPVKVLTHGNTLRYLRECAPNPAMCAFHAVSRNWGLDYLDAHNMLNDYFHPDAGFNAGGWDSPRYRELMELITAEADPAQRLEYIHEAERILVQDDVAAIPIYFTQGAALVPPEIYLDNLGFTQTVARWGASDVDGDGLHDLIDPCPADPEDACSPDGSAAGVVGAAGGELNTTDGNAALEIPAAAVDESITFSITDTGGNYQLVTDGGPSLVAASVQIEPGGTAFAAPVTITLAWPDADDDGLVDGINLVEAALVAVKDGLVISAPCALDPGCDMDANTFAFQVSGLSSFALAGPYAPRIAGITAPVVPMLLAAPVEVSAQILDAEVINQYTVTWDWGDGTSTTSIQAGPVVQGQHAYPAAGLYSVGLTVNEAGYPSASAVYESIVVYNPYGGFVTGAARYQSPQGAYLANTEIQGNVHVNLLFRYDKAGIPFGHFNLRFKDAELAFDGSGLEWLVVSSSGAEAIFKGYGRVNDALAPNQTPYRALVWLADGQPDRLRVKIWWQDAAGIHVLYDALALQVLTQGQIIIHAK